MQTRLCILIYGSTNLHASQRTSHLNIFNSSQWESRAEAEVYTPTEGVGGASIADIGRIQHRISAAATAKRTWMT